MWDSACRLRHLYLGVYKKVLKLSSHYEKQRPRPGLRSLNRGVQCLFRCCGLWYLAWPEWHISPLSPVLYVLALCRCLRYRRKSWTVLDTYLQATPWAQRSLESYTGGQWRYLLWNKLKSSLGFINWINCVSSHKNGSLNTRFTGRQVNTDISIYKS